VVVVVVAVAKEAYKKYFKSLSGGASRSISLRNDELIRLPPEEEEEKRERVFICYQKRIAN